MSKAAQKKKIKETLTKLWDPQQGAGRSNLTLYRIVDIAIELARKNGLKAVSYRKLADKLEVGAMTLYSYISSKDQLIELMVDRTMNAGILKKRSTNARAVVEQIARLNFELFLSSPWLLEVPSTRPVLGKGSMLKYESELRALDNLSMSDRDKDALLSLLIQHAESTARKIIEQKDLQKRTHLNEYEWWEVCAPVLEVHCDAKKFPVANRIGSAAGGENNGPYDFKYGFEFGLEIIIKGLEHE